MSDYVEGEQLFELLTRQPGKRFTVFEQLSGETVVITGTLATMTRDEAREAARAAGATVTDSVSRKTTLLVVGAEAGSKLRKAQELGVAIVDEDEFRRRLGAV